MAEDTFRIVVTVAVALACLAFIVQSIVVIFLYRTARRGQQKFLDLSERLEPHIEKAGPLMDRVTTTLERADPLIAKLAPAVEKLGAVADRAGATLATMNRILEENRPKVSELSKEATDIARSGREQVERLGDLLTDASERARERLAQIDATVESTVEQVENVGDAMKRAVMRPVREVSGLAAGVSAALSSLVGRGSRRSSVDTATQDEEMFI